MKETTLFYPGCEATHSSNTTLRHGRNEGRKALMLAIDPGASQCIGEALDRCGFEPVLLSTVAELRSWIRKSDISVLVCEEVLRDGNYKEVLRVSRGVGGHIPVVVFSRLGEWEYDWAHLIVCAIPSAPENCDGSSTERCRSEV
jgi:hypothetical protein